MRKLVTSRFFRCTLCLILVCCMIVNCIAIKAEASVLGAAAVLFGDDAALAVIAACLAGLGVMAKLETEMDTLTFRHLCEDAYDAMAAAGEWVVDGAVTVYNCATELWDYGVDCGMVQWLHDWLFQSSVLQTKYNSISATPACNSYADALAYAQHCRRAFRSVSDNGDITIIITGNSPYVSLSDGTLTINMTKTSFSVYKGGDKWTFISSAGMAYYYNVVELETSPLIASEYVLGTVAPPGTDIETEYGEYIVIVAPNGVPDTGGDGSGDDQPKIPIIPVPVLPSYEETIRLPQEDIWKGNKVETEDPDTGGSTDPSTGTDTDDPDSGSNDPTTPTTGTDTDSDTQPDTPGTPSSDIGDYQIDLKKFFPFCIPFDLYDFFTCLNADPVAPVIEWVIPLPGGGTYPLVIDLSAFDSVAQLLRRLQLLLFCVGLAFKTRDLIKG